VSVWDTFRARGFFQQVTEGEALEAQPAPLTAYIGFDPTADSFHAGHLIPLMALLHFQREGHRPIALMGGGTAMIGDPTGKNEMRKMLSMEELDRNIGGLKAQLGRFLDFEPRPARPGQPARPGAILANNADWLRGLGYLDFLREVGPHFSVNRMLTFDTFRTRLEGAGLSFLEFNYPLLQSYDFLELHRRHGCTLQMGGDDQWANIISGVDLVRRLARARVFGWTFPLLTTAGGAKMGKTEQGAVWLDPNRTKPYDYYQYWINTDDRDVGKFLRLFTLLPLEEIAELERLQGADIREAKRVLALEATKIIHGDAEAQGAERGARAVFGTIQVVMPALEAKFVGVVGDVPHTEFDAARLTAKPLVVDVLAEVGLAKSRSDARRLVEGGGVTVNEEKVAAIDATLSGKQVVDGGIQLRVGKKKFHRIVVKGG
jgi:tyrosyl-tRNA synthetase